jgi:hypothetical protein
MKKYHAYGLVFLSELDLKPLSPVADHSTHHVSILHTTVSESGIKDPTIIRALAQISDNHVWMDIPGIARFAINNGNEILIDAYPEADEQSIRLYVMGSAMGAILHQRGFLVLHANAIQVGDGAVLFAGISGSGKSTTAAVFHQKGYPVLSDDVVAIDKNGNVMGGIPQIKLWENTLQKLEISKHSLTQIRLKIQKYSFPLPENHQQEKLPIKAIYSLDTANQQEPDHFEFAPLTGVDKFNTLKAHTYRRHFMEGLGLKPAHMQLCSTLASNTHMARLTRPTSRFNALQLVDRVIQDFADAQIIVPA